MSRPYWFQDHPRDCSALTEAWIDRHYRWNSGPVLLRPAACSHSLHLPRWYRIRWLRVLHGSHAYTPLWWYFELEDQRIGPSTILLSLRQLILSHFCWWENVSASIVGPEILKAQRRVRWPIHVPLNCCQGWLSELYVKPISCWLICINNLQQVRWEMAKHTKILGDFMCQNTTFKLG